jgi:hypothetical protein
MSMPLRRTRRRQAMPKLRAPSPALERSNAYAAARRRNPHLFHTP